MNRRVYRLSEREARSELSGHIHVARESWSYAQKWASGLGMDELRQAYRLAIPGDAGLAVEQEFRRRTQGGSRS